MIDLYLRGVRVGGAKTVCGKNAQKRRNVLRMKNKANKQAKLGSSSFPYGGPCGRIAFFFVLTNSDVGAAQVLYDV